MIKYSVNVILWSYQPTSTGDLPIYIQIMVHGKPAYIATGHAIHKNKWDAKYQRVKDSHPFAESINADIAVRKQMVLDKLVEKQAKKQPTTAAEIKLSLTRNLHNIFDYIESFIKEVKNKRTASTLENYRKHLLVLELYHGSRTLHFEDITVKFLGDFETYLSDTKKLSSNYIHAIWKTIKTIFNDAIEKKVVDHYPFKQYENPIYRPPGKDHLTQEELKKWEEHLPAIENKVIYQAALYFLLGAYSGLRISDWVTFHPTKNVVRNRIQLRAKKNGEHVTMPVSTPLARIIELIKKTPLSIEEPTLNEKLKVIAKDLKIDKRISSHVARHTFAITICADRGISCETCAELMGITVATCAESYYRVTNRKIDRETNEAWKDL